MRSSPSRSSAAALLVVAALAAGGCTVLHKQIGDPIAPGQAGLREGRSTVLQIIETLGPPSTMSALPNGAVLLYEYIDAREDQFGLNLDVIGLQWFKFAYGRANGNREELLLFCDGDGILRSKDYRKWNEDLGSGLALQLFFVAMPTVDTRYLSNTQEQHSWGRAALQPLPVTLNVNQSVTSGARGIELRGTPEQVGQRTLEMRSDKRRRARGD